MFKYKDAINKHIMYAECASVCLPKWLGLWSKRTLTTSEGLWPTLILALIFRNRSMLTRSLFPMLNKPSIKTAKAAG